MKSQALLYRELRVQVTHARHPGISPRSTPWRWRLLPFAVSLNFSRLLSSLEKRNFLFGSTTGAFSSFWNRTFVRWGVSVVELPMRNEKLRGSKKAPTKKSRSNWRMIRLHTARHIAFFYLVTYSRCSGGFDEVLWWPVFVLMKRVTRCVSVLPGAGESGKSTIVKQMRILHDAHGFTEQWVALLVLLARLPVTIV